GARPEGELRGGDRRGGDAARRGRGLDARRGGLERPAGPAAGGPVDRPGGAPAAPGPPPVGGGGPPPRGGSNGEERREKGGRPAGRGRGRPPAARARRSGRARTGR